MNERKKRKQKRKQWISTNGRKETMKNSNKTNSLSCSGCEVHNLPLRTKTVFLLLSLIAGST